MPAGLDWQQTRSMGLRLVRLLADQMHGSMEVPGPSGTEFRITSPASRDGEGAAGDQAGGTV